MYAKCFTHSFVCMESASGSLFYGKCFRHSCFFDSSLAAVAVVVEKLETIFIELIVFVIDFISYLLDSF